MPIQVCVTNFKEIFLALFYPEAVAPFVSSCGDLRSHLSCAGIWPLLSESFYSLSSDGPTPQLIVNSSLLTKPPFRERLNNYLNLSKNFLWIT